jgi:hypothetical protein
VTVVPCVCEDSTLLVVVVYCIRRVEVVMVVVFNNGNTDVLVTVTVAVDCAPTELSKASPVNVTNEKTRHRYGIRNFIFLTSEGYRTQRRMFLQMLGSLYRSNCK